MIKKILFLIVLCASSVCAMAQSQTVTHVVQRGETIESIAKQYNVSVDDINRANPNTDGLFYAGMKLVIPVADINSVPIANTQNKAIEQPVQYVSNESNNGNVKIMATESNEGKWCAAIEMGYGFVGKNSFVYTATIGANYLFTPNFYAGARIGYMGSSASSREDGDLNFHFIDIPLELGYKLGGSVGIIPFAGLNINIGLTGKVEDKSQKISTDVKIGGEFGVDARLGLRLHLIGFQITGSYHFPLNDNQKIFCLKGESYPELSIGYMF